MARPRRIRVKPQRKRKPDYRKISAALQDYLAAKAEVDAEALHRSSHDHGRRNQRGSS